MKDDSYTMSHLPQQSDDNDNSSQHNWQCFVSVVRCTPRSAICCLHLPCPNSVWGRLRGSFAELRTLAWQDFKVLKIHENVKMVKIKNRFKNEKYGQKLEEPVTKLLDNGPEPPVDGVWLCQHVRVMMVRYSRDTEGEPWPGTVFAEAASVLQQKQKLRRLQYQVLEPATVTPQHRNSFKHNRSYDISGKAENEGLQSFCNHGEGYSNFTST